MTDLIEIKTARNAAAKKAGIDVLDEVKSRMVNGDLKGASATLVIWISAEGEIDYAMSESMGEQDAVFMMQVTNQKLCRLYDGDYE